MKSTKSLGMIAAVLHTGGMLASLCAADTRVLWQIGQADRSGAEFALAPKDYTRFQQDGCYVVGRSDAKQDWPYAHPGPADGWAGGRPHTFTVLFGLAGAPAAGECRLRLDFVDTQQGQPPRLRAQINGRTFDRSLPAGGGDASIFGDPAKGKPSHWELTFPAELLQVGENEIALTTLSGSWALYDAVRLETPASVTSAPVKPRTWIRSGELPPVHLRAGDRTVQPARLAIHHFADPAEGVIKANGVEVGRVALRQGAQTVEVGLTPVETATPMKFELVLNGEVACRWDAVAQPLRLKELWLLPHSHVDIGYTHRQSDVIDIQIGNLEKAMRLARESATNPPGMRFKWNPEAVWVLDHFLKRATPEKREALLAAVRRGDLGVDGLYGNILTGLCRPEELAQCLGFGARLSTVTGQPVESASICDVPGYTWGLVSMMGQAGVKYFAIGPNFGDRVGTIHLWDNKPFYWRSPSAREKLLCWVVDNYHFFGNLEEHALHQLERLEKIGFPYDTTFLFWVGVWENGGVDNAPPDEKLAEKVVAWNRKYAAPRVIVGLTGEFFRDFEQRNRARLPEHAGDLTPYWEDGAGSTSKETALNRESADRLSQAEFLWTLLAPGRRPAERFDEAWKNVLLYTEHTWGAWCSISKPDDDFTLDQWRVKRQFALDASQQSEALLRDVLATRTVPAATAEWDVFNSTQWPRTDLVTLPKERTGLGDRVTDGEGREVPSQRLRSGELVFLARDVPAFGARRFKLTPGAPTVPAGALAQGNRLSTTRLRLEIDPRTGALKSLRRQGIEADLVDPQAPVGLNDYRYVLGTDAKGAQTNGTPVLRVLEEGPLVASIQIESGAPGCARLVREVRVTEGLDRVELINHVDRLPVREKDGVHFGFGFNVPAGQVRMETPWAVVRPNRDQLPGSCRNWFTVQRWVDISNPDYGVLWAPLDAPLMELGGMTANLLGSVRFEEWMTNALDSRTIYSWAQNNHWHTNYKVDQPGVTTFRFMLRPHAGPYAAGEAARFGLETTRPLVAAPADPAQPAPGSLLTAASPGVLVETVKMSADGKAYLVRLFGVTGEHTTVRLDWRRPVKSMWLSDLTETPRQRLNGAVAVPPYAALTVRAELE